MHARDMKNIAHTAGRSPLKSAVEEDGRKLKWLARTAGIDYQRLQRIANQGYEPTISEAARISNSLKKPLLDLFPSAELEAALGGMHGGTRARREKRGARGQHRQRG